MAMIVGIEYPLEGVEGIYQGADWEKVFQFINPDTKLPYDLSLLTARSQARKKDSDSSPAITFTCSTNQNGLITLSLNNSQTDAIPKGLYTYDVELVSGANVVTKVVLPSPVTVYPGYTK